MHFLFVIAFCLGLIWLCAVYRSFRITVAIFAGVVVVCAAVLGGVVWWTNRSVPVASLPICHNPLDQFNKPPTCAMPAMCTEAQISSWSAARPSNNAPVPGDIIIPPSGGLCTTPGQGPWSNYAK
ncbi:MAG TPA: hypothetical protein VGI36_20230 [Candidatus Binataceae bacterium]|jgi:hypothetical protein